MQLPEKAVFISTTAEFKAISNEYNRWHDFNSELLARIFDSRIYQQEYKVGRSYGFVGLDSIVDEANLLISSINNNINYLRSLQERLPLIDEAASVTAASATPAPTTDTPAVAVSRKDVFLVHGHEGVDTVARFLERLDLNPIVLNEQASLGSTVLEKLEHHRNVAFAVVLMTPDDLGAAKGEADQLRPRARQNVVLELGYFFALLGRGHVAALHLGNLELPSDIAGLIYIPFDNAGAWKFLLAREMQAAGLQIDLNKAM